MAQVVAAALKRPKDNRIKPVCRLYPHVTPVQQKDARIWPSLIDPTG